MDNNKTQRQHPAVVLDVDGTVCRNGHRIDWSSPESVLRLCTPIPEAQARVAVMRMQGWEPVFLSARHSMVPMDAVTFRQIREWFGPDVADAADVLLWDMQASDFGSEDAFHLASAFHKAICLMWIEKSAGKGIYVGDRPSDREAARLARWRFMDAADWRAGAPFVLDGQPMRAAEVAA